MPEFRYTKEEHARLGRALYAKIRPQVEAGNHGRIVAMDVDSGDFEVDDTSMAATDRLLQRHPDAQIWVERVGFRAVGSLGGSWLRPAL